MFQVDASLRVRGHVDLQFLLGVGLRVWRPGCCLLRGPATIIDKSVMGVGFRDHGYGTTPSREKGL